MIQYLTSLDELKQNALGEKLGTMEEGSYAHYMEQARALAAAQGVTSPKLIIALDYISSDSNVGGLENTVYPVMEEEWDLLTAQTQEFFKSSPAVYAVDGSKFTAYI